MGAGLGLALQREGRAQQKQPSSSLSLAAGGDESLWHSCSLLGGPGGSAAGSPALSGGSLKPPRLTGTAVSLDGFSHPCTAGARKTGLPLLGGGNLALPRVAPRAAFRAKRTGQAVVTWQEATLLLPPTASLLELKCGWPGMGTEGLSGWPSPFFLQQLSAGHCSPAHGAAWLDQPCGAQREAATAWASGQRSPSPLSRLPQVSLPP